MANLIKDQNGEIWFMEKGQLWPGQAFSLKVKKVLYDQKSKFQHIQVLESSDYGNVLVLDGVIQLTERDEFAYQEMISHIPLNAHSNPKNVLVIGGGDGGVVREILRHTSVDRVTLVEIDSDVIEVSMKYFGNITNSLNNPKVHVHIGDGFEYLNNNSGFDVVIADSSDPVGPAESLFQNSFLQLVKNALNPGGIVCTQAECLWLHGDIIRSLYENAQSIFANVKYAYTTIPSYPSGQIGFLLCSENVDLDLDMINPKKKLMHNCIGDEEMKKLRYYCESIHHAAFVLPKFAQELLKN